MSQLKHHRMFVLCAVLIGFNITTFVHGQVNSELDLPFVTKGGEVYRDRLTIASAKSVAHFAKSYQRRQNGQARRDKRISKSSRGRLQTATFSTFGVGYDPKSHAAAFDKRFPAIDFRASRRLRYLAKHKRERVKADIDEARLVNEDTRRVAPRRQTSTRFANRRPKPQRPKSGPSTAQRLRSRPAIPKRPRAQAKRRRPVNRFRARTTPRPIHRFIALTTPRPTPEPEIHQIFNTQHALNVGRNVQTQDPIITSRVIIPAAEYYKSVTDYQPSPNYQYVLGTTQPQITQVKQSTITSVPATTYPLEVDQYGQFFGTIPVNYGFSINHL